MREDSESGSLWNAITGLGLTTVPSSRFPAEALQSRGMAWIAVADADADARIADVLAIEPDLWLASPVYEPQNAAGENDLVAPVLSTFIVRPADGVDDLGRLIADIEDTGVVFDAPWSALVPPLLRFDVRPPGGDGFRVPRGDPPDPWSCERAVRLGPAGSPSAVDASRLPGCEPHVERQVDGPRGGVADRTGHGCRRRDHRLGLRRRPPRPRRGVRPWQRACVLLGGRPRPSVERRRGQGLDDPGQRRLALARDGGCGCGRRTSRRRPRSDRDRAGVLDPADSGRADDRRHRVRRARLGQGIAGAGIVNLSITAAGWSNAVDAAIELSADDDTVICAAAGNDDGTEDEVVYPATDRRVLAVGGGDRDRRGEGRLQRSREVGEPARCRAGPHGTRSAHTHYGRPRRSRVQRRPGGAGEDRRPPLPVA